MNSYGIANARYDDSDGIDIPVVVRNSVYFCNSLLDYCSFDIRKTRLDQVCSSRCTSH